MRTNVVTIEATEAASVAWTRMQQKRIRHLVVTKKGHVVGVVSERDLGGRDGKEVRQSRTVQDLMSSEIVTADPSLTLRQAANLMRGRLVGSLPVVEDDRLVGIVTATDVLDELGRGFTRPDVGGRRRVMRSAPPSRGKSDSNPTVYRRSRGSGKTGLARAREPDSQQRSPMTGKKSKASKRQSSRREPAPVSAYIRRMGVELGPDDRDFIRRKLGMKLGKFGSAIERVSVRVKDINGPRGGVDQACRIKVVLSGLPSVVFESHHVSLQSAIDSALTGSERAVRRALQRRRTKAARRAA